jgi:hypothetical protein
VICCGYNEENMLLIAFEFVAVVFGIAVFLLALSGLIYVTNYAWNIFLEALKGLQGK